MKENNIMREIKIEKVVLSIGGTAESLEKGYKLLERLTGKKPKRVKSTKRIPSLNVRPGLEVGCFVTLRKKEVEEMLPRLFAAEENKLKKKQISQNSFSFGVKEYIEIPGFQYQRDIGIIGLDATVTFTRAGKRIARKKWKRGKIPARQHVSVEEIIKFVEEKFQIEVN